MQAGDSGGKPTWAPRKKVVAGGLAGAISFIIIFILNTYVIHEPNSKLPADVASALTAVLSALTSYFVSPGSNESTIQ